VKGLNHGEHREHGELVFKELSEGIIGSAIEVHKQLGPGLLESAYETCLAYELEQNGFDVERQKAMPLKYRSIELDCGYRLDLLVNGKAIVEIKAIENFLPIHDAQLLTYMKLANCLLGLLINFNETLLKHGIRRFVL
jgi:GxxExxY protein